MNYKNFLTAGLMAASLPMEGCKMDHNESQAVRAETPMSIAPSPDDKALQQLGAELRNDLQEADIDLGLERADTFRLCYQMYGKRNVPDYLGGIRVETASSIESEEQTQHPPQLRVIISRSVQYVLDGKKVSATCSHQKNVSHADTNAKNLQYYVSKNGKDFVQPDRDFTELKITEEDSGVKTVYIDNDTQSTETGELLGENPGPSDGIADSFMKINRTQNKPADSFTIGDPFYSPKNAEDKRNNDERAARTVQIQAEFEFLVDEGVQQLRQGDYAPMKIIDGKLRTF
jgi:translation elongation factor P/translation initiation factor 5A